MSEKTKDRVEELTRIHMRLREIVAEAAANQNWGAMRKLDLAAQLIDDAAEQIRPDDWD